MKNFFIDCAITLLDFTSTVAADIADRLVEKHRPELNPPTHDGWEPAQEVWEEVPTRKPNVQVHYLGTDPNRLAEGDFEGFFEPGGAGYTHGFLPELPLPPIQPAEGAFEKLRQRFDRRD